MALQSAGDMACFAPSCPFIRGMPQSSFVSHGYTGPCCHVAGRTVRRRARTSDGRLYNVPLSPRLAPASWPLQRLDRAWSSSQPLARPGSLPVRRPAQKMSASGNADDEVIDQDMLFLRGPVPGDRVVRTMSANGEVSVRVLACTGLVSGAARLHRTSPVAAAAFGRTITCAVLLASGKKDGETLQLEIRGDGPIRGITAIANGDGQVRGYLGNPFVELPPNADGKLDVGTAVGKGLLAVVRNSPFAKQPYTGLVPLVSGEIAEDVAAYLADSEQTPSALGAGVYVSDSGDVTAAGGYLVQLLPGASEETIATVERNVTSLPPPSELVRSGISPDDICLTIMRDLSPLDLASSSPRYHCACNADRVKRTVALIPEIEVYDLLATRGTIEAICEFCGRRWELTRPEIEELFRAKNEAEHEREAGHRQFPVDTEGEQGVN